jgi:hypothetical protein
VADRLGAPLILFVFSEAADAIRKDNPRFPTTRAHPAANPVVPLRFLWGCGRSRLFRFVFSAREQVADISLGEDVNLICAAVNPPAATASPGDQRIHP